MNQQSLSFLIAQHDRLVDGLQKNAIRDKIIQLLQNLHLEGGETTTHLSVYLGSGKPYDREAIRLAASIVKDATRKMLPLIAEAALVMARERFQDHDAEKQEELMQVKQQIREQLELIVDQPAFLRKIMD
jgi:hypothetical protein